MKVARGAVIAALVIVAQASNAQAWKDAYGQALDAIKNQDWLAARTAFQRAVAVRPDDQATPTTLPGPVTDPVRWRDGSPYSPNFGIAYCTYKLAVASPEDQRGTYLSEAATGFETLLAKNQAAPATFYFLNEVYTMSKQLDKQRGLEEKMAQAGASGWKVDSSIMSPEEVATVNAASAATTGGATGAGVVGAGPVVTVVNANAANTGASTTSIAGRVPVVPNKFALIIGNSTTQMTSGGLPFAASDAMAVRDAIVQHAGYDERNVDIVQDGSADQMMAVAKALAERMPADGTVLIYFSGIGVHVDGSDYFAGIDASMATDTNKMVAKSALYKVFRDKGASIFCFSQANRPTVGGNYFGREVPITGMVAQCQATSPDGKIYSTSAGGKLIGVYTKAFIDTLATFRSNRVPVTEFSWNVFQVMQGGPANPGGGEQIPSLPTIRYMDRDASF